MPLEPMRHWGNLPIDGTNPIYVAAHILERKGNLRLEETASSTDELPQLAVYSKPKAAQLLNKLAQQPEIKPLMAVSLSGHAVPVDTEKDIDTVFEQYNQLDIANYLGLPATAWDRLTKRRIEAQFWHLQTEYWKSRQQEAYAKYKESREMPVSESEREALWTIQKELGYLESEYGEKSTWLLAYLRPLNTDDIQFLVQAVIDRVSTRRSNKQEYVPDHVNIDRLGKLGIKIMPISEDYIRSYEARILGSKRMCFPYAHTFPDLHPNATRTGLFVNDRIEGISVAGIYQKDQRSYGEIGWLHIAPYFQDFGLGQLFSLIELQKLIDQHPQILTERIADETGKAVHILESLGFKYEGHSSSIGQLPVWERDIRSVSDKTDAYYQVSTEIDKRITSLERNGFNYKNWQ